MLMPGAEPYFFPGKPEKMGILLVHGYSGSPAEVRELAERLHNEEGYTTLGVLLPGHGSDPHELMATTWEDWYLAVKAGVQKLRKTCSQVVIIGMSMGSLLTLVAASELKIDGIVVMSTPIYLYDWRVHFLWLARRLGWALPKGKRIIDAEARFNVSYNCMPFKGVQETWKLINYCKGNILHKVKVPCLIMQSKNEHTVRPLSAQFIYKKISSAHKRIVWIKNSRHVLTLFGAREEVLQDIKDFLKELK